MSELLMWVLGIVGVLVVLSVVTKNQVIGFIAKLSLGPFMIIVMNQFLPTYAIGINYFTMCIAGVLGMPGVMTLYLFQMIL